MDPLKTAKIELVDVIEDGVAVVLSRTHDGAGDGVGEIHVDRTTDVAKCVQMVVAWAHNAGNVDVERQTAVKRYA